jgi:hypothetical protein
MSVVFPEPGGLVTKIREELLAASNLLNNLFRLIIPAVCGLVILAIAAFFGAEFTPLQTSPLQKVIKTEL